MYPAAKTATRVATNVTIASIIVVRPSTWNWIGIERPVIVSHSIGAEVASTAEPPSSPSETRNARAIPRTTGRCACCRSQRPPIAAQPAPRRGRAGTIQALRTRASIGRAAPGAVGRRRDRGLACGERRGRSVAAARPAPGGVRRLDPGGGRGADRFRARRRGRNGSASSGESTVAGVPGSRISCQSETSSDDRRLKRIRIRARAIDASQAATVRITIVKTWPVQFPW